MCIHVWYSSTRGALCLESWPWDCGSLHHASPFARGRGNINMLAVPGCSNCGKAFINSAGGCFFGRAFSCPVLNFICHPECLFLCLQLRVWPTHWQGRITEWWCVLVYGIDAHHPKFSNNHYILGKTLTLWTLRVFWLFLRFYTASNKISSAFWAQLLPKAEICSLTACALCHPEWLKHFKYEWSCLSLHWCIKKKLNPNLQIQICMFQMSNCTSSVWYRILKQSWWRLWHWQVEYV